MKIVRIVIFQVIVCCLFYGSMQAQSKLRSWKTDEDFDPGFKKMLVIGMIESTSFRLETEEVIVSEARKNDIQARMGIFKFPPGLGSPFEDMAKVRNGLMEKGYDGLLSVAIFRISAKRYIPPDKVYVPVGYYSRFGSYYNNSYAVIRTPGYLTTEDQFFIECNLYNLKDGKLIWSGRTSAFPQNTLSSRITKFSKQLFKELKTQGIISKD
ncbi:hypothetical protein [uncultured Muriicola sp.]|uniref:hypothetical protein n=1 Tax=uncultured Muriicola sp. TaxID=1583102 RepID=UPI00261A37FC|nr:hypothetical protein [uncultured Muriicola sp.]